MKTMGDREFISLHDNGDRTIVVGAENGSQRVYKVLTSAMSMASPHWKTMFSLAYGFRESQPDVPIEFPEDDPDALLILLRIAHLRFGELPKSISFQGLIQLAILCDKYDAVLLVQPFIEKWVTTWVPLCLEPGYEEWLFVAWAFGCRCIFEQLAAKLVPSIRVDEQGQCLTSTGTVLGGAVHTGLIDTLLKAREKVIAKLLELCDITSNELVADKWCNNAIHNQRLCNAASLGLLTRAMHPSGLWPQEHLANQCNTSVAELAKSFERFDGFPLQWFNRIGVTVSSCDLSSRLKPFVIAIMEENVPGLEESDIRHMEEQAKKSGIGDLKF